MLSRLLVPVRGDGMSETTLTAAAALARRHKAHIVVAHCRAQAETMVPYSSLLPKFARETLVSQAAELADQEETELRASLHEAADRLGLQETERPDGSAATVEFREAFERMPDVIKHFGRLADLIVVAKPDRDSNLGTNTLKSALFQTGRPVLMCPPGLTLADDFAQNIAIGWNGSLEAARAVAVTMDFSKTADSVTILASGSGEPHGATADELVEYLRLRGVTAKIHRFDARKPGAALLENTVELGASLLVMGAYGQSHERETLFGGNTQTVVDMAEVPVVLAH